MLIHEQKFVEKLKEDIDNFAEKSSFKKCVLVFPPFLSKYRYLAHQVVNEYFFPTLSSFSIGVGDQRRVIVGSTTYTTSCCLPYRCVHDKLSHISKAEVKPVKCVCATRFISLTSPTSVLNPSMPSSKGDKSMKAFKRESAGNCPEGEESHPKRNSSSLGERHKRPDKQLYVPRALRGFQNKRLPIQEKCEDFDEKKSCNPKKQDLCSQSEINSIVDCGDSFASDTKCGQPIDNSQTVQSKDLEIEESISFSTSSSITKNTSNDAISIPTILEQENTKPMQNNHLLDISQVFVIKDPSGSLNSNEGDASGKVVKDVKIICEVNDTLKHKYQNSEIEPSDISTNDDLKCESFEEIALSKCDKTTSEMSDQVKSSIKDEEHDSWETKFDDDGECLNPDFVKELTNVVGRIQIRAARKSYSEYQPLSESMSGEYDNIVELYGFPKEFSTPDLVSALSFFQQSSYTIKWVDDNHALALFSSPAIVNQALQLNHPFVKVRPLSEGIKESKAKARWFASNCEPSKPRPATSAVLARRLVSGALGLKVQTTKEQREMERTMLKEAKEKRKLKAKQRQDIWNGLV